MLEGCVIFLLPAGDLMTSRISILSKQVIKHGGDITPDFNANVTHFLCDGKYDQPGIQRLLDVDSLPVGPRYVRVDWLTDTLKHRSKQDESTYLLKCKPCSSNSEGAIINSRKRKSSPMKMSDNDSSSEDELGKPLSYILTTKPDEPGSKYIKTGSWICAHSSSTSKSYNEHIIEILTKMADTYSHTSDKWRAFAYHKAISALRKLSKPIETKEEALSLPGVGQRIAEKIWEIACSGKLNKLDALQNNETIQLMKAFNDVWGAGPQTAQSWIQAGFTSIEDLRARVPDHLITKQQRLGLRHYEEFLERIPREEVGEIESFVRSHLIKYGEDLQLETCGSYRRGKPTCGDVDILIWHPTDKKIHNDLLMKLIQDMEASGFLTAHLVTCSEEGEQKKYLGICKLPGTDKCHRRIDIITCPAWQLACARLYFTGSVHFTRSVRSLAKKMGLRLDNHSLCVRPLNSESKTTAQVLSTPDEESIFKHLKIPYRPPNERDH